MTSPARRKVYPSPGQALADLSDGAVVLIAGFAGCGWPEALLNALKTQGSRNLTIVCQGAWLRQTTREGSFAGVDALVANGQVSKLISPLPFLPDGHSPGAESSDRESGYTASAVEDSWRSGELEIEVVPQGVLAERLRAGGAGLGGVFIPAATGTRFAEQKEVRRFGEREYVFEPGLRADFALLRAHAADTLGNLIYTSTQRNWNPTLAMAGRVSVVEVDEIFEPGSIDPELVITPGIFVNRIVQTV